MQKRSSVNNRSHCAVFDLSSSQLRPIVNRIAREEVSSFEVTGVHPKRGANGICGDYAVPTFAYTTRSGRTGTATVFAKRPHSRYAEHREAHHYAFLSAQGVPVPRLYGVVCLPDRREILFMEHLEENTVDDDVFLADPNRYKAFLSLMARLNAVRPAGEYADRLLKDLTRRPWCLDWEEWLTWGARMLDVVAERAFRDELGEALRILCAESQNELRRLKSLAVELIDPVTRMVQGYVHSDLYPGNVGWRKGTQELVVFDLADIRFQARFYDVARWLGAPDGFCVYPLPRLALADHYIAEYPRYGGEEVALAPFLEECRILWVARHLNLWNPQIGNPDDEPDHRPPVSDETQASLHRTLSALVTAVRKREGRA